ncbi:hypothetical protein TSAR_013525 [Trichomalopsis sarcophagae]|uniref:BTB domain-containing protein n=1 Tax=Trichomalopsis sarcophagae TaxID=543379 RepID=A0A232FDH4_9HYME|nr:hypothetical protein TSAR_013525 [Trichomalopsis sarcophagae]
MQEDSCFELHSEPLSTNNILSGIRLCLKGTPDVVHFHMLDISPDLEFHDLRVTLIGYDHKILHKTGTTTKESHVVSVSLQLSSVLKVIAWEDVMTIHCEFDSPSNDYETKKEKPFIYGKRHTSKALDQFESLLDNSEYSDVKFIVGKKTLYAHKIILAARSSVFSAMFRHCMREKEQTIINIEEISYEVLKEVLRYIYAGKVNQNGSIIAKELIVAADKYNIVELKDECGKLLCNSLTSENAIECLNFAYLHNIDNLRESAIGFIVQNGKDMLNKPGFDSLGDLNKELMIFEIEKTMVEELGENNYKFQALDRFETLPDNQEFADIKFVVNDKTIYANKLIQSQEAPFFLIFLFKKKDERCQRKYQIEKFAKMCKNMSIDNVIEYHHHSADLHNVQQLRKKAIDIIILNGKMIAKRPDFNSLLKLHEDLVLEIVRSELSQEGI